MPCLDIINAFALDLIYKVHLNISRFNNSCWFPSYFFYLFTFSKQLSVYTAYIHNETMCVVDGWRGGGWVVYIALIYLFRPFDILPLQNSVITSINTRIYARTVHITWFIVVCECVYLCLCVCLFVCVCMHGWCV